MYEDDEARQNEIPPALEEDEDEYQQPSAKGDQENEFKQPSINEIAGVDSEDYEEEEEKKESPMKEESVKQTPSVAGKSEKAASQMNVVDSPDPKSSKAGMSPNPAESIKSEIQESPSRQIPEDSLPIADTSKEDAPVVRNDSIPEENLPRSQSIVEESMP